jgi:cephalosporin hydroxylase
MPTFDLDFLAAKYGTDKGVGKGEHQYTPAYAHLLSNKLIYNLLEIGIYKGESLRMWAEYLPATDIFGFDCDPQTLINNGRIKSYLVDQAHPDTLQAAAIATGRKFDIVIDDGSHIPEHQVSSIATLYPFLALGGYYIIEDIYPENLAAVLMNIPFFPKMICQTAMPPTGGADSFLVVVQKAPHE